uniref:DH domain-containing protein n=1 Tax=Caenorhabditis tropicalis TaxID=1561998 RepID=A0A1I7USX6_9PELO
MYEDEKPPLPSSPPPETVEPTRNVTFSLLNTESPIYDYNLATPSSGLYRYSPSSPGIPLVADKPAYFDFLPATSSSWTYPMIVEEGIKNAGRPTTPRSIANSLDSLSECAQHHHSDNANTNGDRSRSLGDLLSAANQDGNDALRNGSYDTLVSKGGGLTDSGIGAGLLMMRDDLDMDSSSSPDRIPTNISSPDSYSYPAVLFHSYDPVSPGGSVVSAFSNENTNPLESHSRGHSQDDRKYSELPAITEESEHEQSIHIPYNFQLHQPHSSSVGPLPPHERREIVEHTYPMVHCNSAPNASVINNNIAHRRVVSEDGTEVTRLKRSEEMENMDRIGRNLLEKRSSSTHNLKKDRCKSAMLMVNDTDEEEEDEDDVDGYSKDNTKLLETSEDRYRMSKASSPLRHYDNHSNLPSISSTEPPPVLIQRKVSAVSTRSSPQKTASDQSWKDKMPPLGMVGHYMYSPQSLPTRDAVPRSPFDGTGSISAASVGGSQRLISVQVPTTTTTSPDGRVTSEPEDVYTPLRSRLYQSIPSPPALLAANECSTEDLMPLSELCNQNRFSYSSSINTELSSPSGKSQTVAATPNSSFVRRSLRKIMKRGSVSTSALGGDEGLRTGSLKRRASNASSFFASAQAHLRPRTKSLKKQRIGKKPKEKSGSDTFTFGNLFRKKPPTSRPNLADIISDLDQRSTTSRQMSSGGSLSAAKNRRSTSATILPMSGERGGGGLNDPTTPFHDSSSLDGLPDHISRMVSPLETSHASTSSTNGNSAMNNVYTQLNRLYGKYDLFGAEEYQSWHEKYRHNTLSTKQVKKQDAIFEMYLMEKRHCANIAFLLQGYRRRMLDENIISRQDMDVLIPDVLEPLLIFHLNVLERITGRIQENCEVGTISDIISEELAIDGGQHTKLCCDAYTDFGVAKERSDVLYHHLMNKNAKFAEFFKKTYNEEPFYKHYDFRPLVTKIIGRATKYSLLLETILKNEQPFSEHHDLTKLALETARKFAHKIDENLSMAHMSMKWEEIRAQIDSSSTTNLYVSDPSVPNGTIRYTFDLQLLNSAPNRKLVYLGEALIKIPNMPTGGGTHSSSSGKQLDKKTFARSSFSTISL